MKLQNTLITKNDLDVVVTEMTQNPLPEQNSTEQLSSRHHGSENFETQERNPIPSPAKSRRTQKNGRGSENLEAVESYPSPSPEITTGSQSNDQGKDVTFKSIILKYHKKAFWITCGIILGCLVILIILGAVNIHLRLREAQSSQNCVKIKEHKLSEERLSYDEAEAFCSELKLTLWDVKDEPEWNFGLERIARFEKQDFWLCGKADGSKCPPEEDCLKVEAKRGEGVSVLWNSGASWNYSRLYRGPSENKRCIYSEGKPARLWTVGACNLEKHYALCINRGC